MMIYTDAGLTEAFARYLNGEDLEPEEWDELRDVARAILTFDESPDLDAPHILPEDFAA